MLSRLLKLLPLVVLPAGAMAANPVITKDLLVKAAVESATDNISSGWCGRGMLSILRKFGLGADLQGSNGQDWEQNLLRAGWKPVRVSSPERAPLGSVLVYLGDKRAGKTPRGTPGGYFGHVEMVALGPNGGRLYVSDSPRVKPGGTVRDNFTGRAWLPPGGVPMWKTQSPEQQVATVLNERKRMAFAYFERNGRPEFTSLASVSEKKSDSSAQ
jgi:hypothetical protein